jgi:hypothetical protein
MSYIDSETGESIDGKALIVRTTDGEIVVDPRRVFGDDVLAEQLAALEARVAELEAAATAPDPEPGV